MQRVSIITSATLAAIYGAQVAIATDSSHEHTYTDSEYVHVTDKLSDLTQKSLSSMLYQYTEIPVEGGRYILKLKKKLVLDFNGTGFNILGWDIKGCSYDHIDREVARKFKEIYLKSLNCTLTQSEKKLCSFIVQNVDIEHFESQISDYIYAVGTLISKKQKLIIKWRNGPRDELPKSLKCRLSEINENEEFSCKILRRHGETVDIKDIFLKTFNVSIPPNLESVMV